MNSTDTVNLKNARLITILNAGREQLDRLRGSIDSKTEILNHLDNYSSEFEKKVLKSLECDLEEIRQKAQENLDIVIESVAHGASERDLQEKLRQKTELHSINTELQIQADFLYQAESTTERCMTKLHQILIEVENKLEEVSQPAIL